MSEASMIGVFNAKINAFNKAVREGDAQAVCDTGAEMLHIVVDECSKPGVASSVKDVYRKQGKAVLDHIVRMAKSRPAPTGAGGGQAAGGDPYYAEKDWFSDDVPALGFKDIIGVQEVKDAFMADVVAPLRPEFREVYRRFRGDQANSQILLYGPPGSGKTHIVRCLAGALNCKIAIVSASEVLASVVGVAEKNIRDVFAQAEKLERCIIFIDEIDSLCSDRDSPDSRNTKSVLTTLLTCMDGFIKTTEPGRLRIIVAATNLPWKLDPALKRGGRFETQIYVPLPDRDGRIMFVHNGLSKVPHAADVTEDWLAERMKGYSGADIKAMLRQIANRPLRREIKNITEKKGVLGERVTREDCEQVIKNYINPVNTEMLLRFEAYNKGMSYVQYLTKLKAEVEAKGKKDDK